MTDNIVDQFKAMSQLPPEVKYKILVPNPDAILKSGHLTYAAFDENFNFIGTIEVFDANRFGKKANEPSRGSGDGFFKFIPSGEQSTLITPTQHYTQTVIDAPEEIINLMRRTGVNFAAGGELQVIARVQVFNGETSYSGYQVSFEAHVTMADGSEGSITFTKVQQLVDMGSGPWMEVSGWVGEFKGKNSALEDIEITTPEFALFASDPTDPDGKLYPVVRNPTTGKLERVPEEGGGYKSFSIEEYIENLGVEGRRTIEEMQEFENLLNGSQVEINGLREETLREFALQQEESVNTQLEIDSIADLPEGATSFVPEITFDLSNVDFDPEASSVVSGDSILLVKKFALPLKNSILSPFHQKIVYCPHFIAQ